jgi:hypothetical protein
MKAICLILVLTAATPVLADGSPTPAKQQDPYGVARPIVHFDSRRQQIPQAPKPGAEKPLGMG